MDASTFLIAVLAQLGVICFTLTIYSVLRDRVHGDQTAAYQIFNGLLLGGTAAFLMLMPGELMNGFDFDLRIVPLAVVGVISGPVGAGVASSVATAYLFWIGDAGAGPGVLGIWFAFGVCILGYLLSRRGHHAYSDIVVFSVFNAGLGLLILLLLPPAMRMQLIDADVLAVLLVLNFVATLMAAFFVRTHCLRRKNAHGKWLHKQIVCALPDALNVKDREGRLLLAKPTATDMGAKYGTSTIGKADFEYYNSREASQFLQQEPAGLADLRPIVLQQQLERDRKITWLSTIKAPYSGECGTLSYNVSQNADTSAQTAMHAELVSTKVLLETAMNEMADGLAMFDREGRLVFWNRRYLEFFPYVNEMTCQGCTLPELLLAGVLRGDIKILEDISPLIWIQKEVERSKAAANSELMLREHRWISKTTRLLTDGGWVTLYSDVSEKKTASAKLERLASTDGLTELLNRRSFDRQLEAAFETARRTLDDLSLLMIDIDYFKAYNDTYGHPAGDEILRQVSGVLLSACRTQVDIVARYGGEEFAVILPGTSEEVSHVIAIRLLSAVRMLEIPHVASPKGHVTISAGLVCISDDISDCQHFLKLGDELLYAAKANGRDNVKTLSTHVSPKSGSQIAMV